MTDIRINLYSDTQTLPSAAMRQAIAQAPVGDEQSHADPSVNKLCETVAELLGKEAAVFMPSGTMCNEIALRVHCRPGDEIVAERGSHIIAFEGGGPAALSGASIWPIDGERGRFSADQLQQAVRPVSRYMPRSKLVVIEQTANLGGGTVWPLEQIKAVAERAAEHQLLMHLDGARLLNAVVASGISAKQYAEPFASAWIDLSKGLGCPVGAVLAGSQAFIEEVWWWKQRLGGAMRQAGILAAAGLYALEHNIERMAEDHANARLFGERIADIPGIGIDLNTIDTNMVFFDISGTNLSGDEICQRLLQRGVRISQLGATRLRAVTHLDINRSQVIEAARALRDVCETG